MRPPSRTTLGIDASMMTLLGTCRLVTPLRESTIARGGRSAYTASMSASTAARSSAGSFATFSNTPARPSFTLAPIARRVPACFRRAGS